MPSPRVFRRIVEAVLVWAAASALLALFFHLAERAWLAELPEESRHTALLLRAIAITMCAAMVAGVYILVRVAPALGPALRSTPPQAEHSVSEPVGRSGLAGWLLGLRWLAVLVLVPVVTIATLVAGNVALDAAVPLWLGVGVLLAFNVAWTLAGARRSASQRALTLHLVFDVLWIAWMTHHTGGIANPFTGLFVLHTLLAVILLEGRTAKIATAAIAVLVALQTGLEASGALPPLPLGGAGAAPVTATHLAASGLGTITVLLGCAWIAGTLVRTFREERVKLTSVLDCMADAVVYVSPDGGVLLRNQAAARLWAGQPEPARDLRVCHSNDVWQRLLAKLANPGAHELHPVLHVQGRAHEATYARVCDADRHLLGVVMVARDVTERLELQRAQMREERMSVVGKLAAGLAHEINNPLGAIALFTQHALRGVEPGSDLADHLRTVQRNADQCKKIVRDLLTYARQRAPERVKLDLRDVIDDATRTLRAQAERAGVTLEVTCPDAPLHPIEGDPDQLRQVLVNLGLNAIEAMPGGGQLRFEARNEGPDGARIEVSDTGPGIASEHLDRVFSAFFTTKPEGTGLGLAVARDIVQAHQGEIELESAAGRGATFRIRLPPSRSAGTEVVA